MKCLRRSLLFLSLPFVLGGCLGYERLDLNADLASGKVECVYRNLTSSEEKLAGEKNSVESDWLDLKEIVDKKAPWTEEEGPDGLEVVKTALFEDQGFLSGRLSCRFLKPQAPVDERLEILGELVDADFEMTHGVITMLAKSGQRILASNGRISSREDGQALVTWPAGQKKLEVSFSGDEGERTSLLKNYLSEMKKAR